MSTGMKAVNEHLASINNEALTIEKWRPIAPDAFPALYIAVVGLFPPVIEIIRLRDASAHVFKINDQPELMILQYNDGKPICFRRR